MGATTRQREKLLDTSARSTVVEFYRQDPVAMGLISGQIYSVSFISAFETNKISTLFRPESCQRRRRRRKREACLKEKRIEKKKRNDKLRECYVKLREYETTVGGM